MNARAAVLGAVILAACSAGRYEWRPAAGPLDEQRLRADIAGCEEYREQVEAKGPKTSSAGARAYGGWGNPTFEFCMNKRGWTLQQVRPGEAAPPATAQAPGAAERGAAPPPPGPQATGAPPAVGLEPADCPAALPGTRLLVGDTDDGEAITFTTYPERVGELRRRVRALAALHGRPAGGADPAATPPSRVTVEDVADGARLIVTPADPADLPRVRAAVRTQADRMRERGACDAAAGGP